MQARILTIITFLSIVYEKINGFTYKDGVCGLSTKTQSPINIISGGTSFYEENFFRLLTNNYGEIPQETKWELFPTEKSFGFNIKSNTATIQIVKDWSIYQYTLTKVLFRSKSEHRIDGNIFDVEMQLFHDLDDNYIPIGRQIDQPIKKLIISLFFMKAKTNEVADNFFLWSNLAGFASSTSTTFTKRILLCNLVQNVPSYLYQGTYSYPDCADTLWMISTKYALISNSDFSNITKVLERAVYKDILTDVNGRDVNFFVNSKLVYRNFNNIQKLTPEKSYFRYDSSSFMEISIIISVLVFLIF